MIGPQVTLFDNKIVKLINMMFLLILFSTTITSHRVDGSDIIMKEDFELDRHLKLINKPPIKSIQVFTYLIHVFILDII